MKNINIKLLTILSCLLFGGVQLLKAQAHSEGTYIYQEQKYQRYILIEFNGRTATVGTGNNLSVGYYKSDLIAGFRKSATWANDVQKDRGNFYYDEEKSTSSRWVYKQKGGSGSGSWDKYLAVSKDMSTMIIWGEDQNGIVDGWDSGSTGKTNTCVRVDPQIFIPHSQSNNYDFLND